MKITTANGNSWLCILHHQRTFINISSILLFELHSLIYVNKINIHTDYKHTYIKDTCTTFYVAEVISNNNDSLTVQWWAPSAISKSKGGKYDNNAFEAQPTKHRIQNRQKGAPQWRLKPHLDNVSSLKNQSRLCCS